MVCAYHTAVYLVHRSCLCHTYEWFPSISWILDLSILLSICRAYIYTWYICSAGYAELRVVLLYLLQCLVLYCRALFHVNIYRNLKNKSSPFTGYTGKTETTHTPSAPPTTPVSSFHPLAFLGAWYASFNLCCRVPSTPVYPCGLLAHLSCETTEWRVA